MPQKYPLYKTGAVCKVRTTLLLYCGVDPCKRHELLVAVWTQKKRGFFVPCLAALCSRREILVSRLSPSAFFMKKFEALTNCPLIWIDTRGNLEEIHQQRQIELLGNLKKWVPLNKLEKITSRWFYGLLLLCPICQYTRYWYQVSLRYISWYNFSVSAHIADTFSNEFPVLRYFWKLWLKMM